MDGTRRSFVVVGDNDGICVRGSTRYAYTTLVVRDSIGSVPTSITHSSVR